MSVKEKAEEAHPSEDNAFDEIMLQVGNSGKFQKNYNLIFNFFFVITATMASFLPFIIVAIPDHWCQVPGRELTNFSIEEWKNLTIPRKSTQFSRCTMYSNVSNDTETECTHGWEYDTKYYTNTIPTQEDWVCQKEMHATNFLVAGRIGEIIGTVFAQMGDIYGRRPVFYATIICMILGKLGLLVSKGYYILFIAFSAIGSLPSLSIFVTPLVISLEISSVEDRAFVPLLQSIGWTVGICVGPLIYWALGDWVMLTLISTLPMVPFLFLRNYMIESPRWLASRGQTKKCMAQLKKIAKQNNTQLSEQILLDAKSITPEKNYGAMSLFSSRNMAKKSIVVIIGWICYMIIYIMLLMNVSNLQGNPFLNYLWQGLAELPGYFLGRYLSDTLGRKYTKVLSFLAIAIVALFQAYVLSSYEHVIIISVCGIVMKFLTSVEFYAMNLQTLEIYPTCLRQTGASVGYLIASIFGILTPYIVYLGISMNKSYPYICCGILALIGCVTGIFLPETLNETLPETISDAEHFGADQKLWSLPNRKNPTHKVVSNKVI